MKRQSDGGIDFRFYAENMYKNGKWGDRPSEVKQSVQKIESIYANLFKR